MTNAHATMSIDAEVRYKKPNCR